MDPRPRGPGLQALNLNPFLLLRSATAATVPPAAPAGEGGPPAPPPNLTSNRRLQQTQAQVDEVRVCVCQGARRWGWQIGVGAHLGLKVMTVYARGFWVRDPPCPISVCT